MGHKPAFSEFWESGSYPTVLVDPGVGRPLELDLCLASSGKAASAALRDDMFLALTRLRARYGRSRRPSQTSEPAAFHRSFSPGSSTLPGKRACCSRLHCSCAPTD